MHKGTVDGVGLSWPRKKKPKLTGKFPDNPDVPMTGFSLAFFTFLRGFLKFGVPPQEEAEFGLTLLYEYW